MLASCEPVIFNYILTIFVFYNSLNIIQIIIFCSLILWLCLSHLELLAMKITFSAQTYKQTLGPSAFISPTATAVTENSMALYIPQSLHHILFRRRRKSLETPSLSCFFLSFSLLGYSFLGYCKKNARNTHVQVNCNNNLLLLKLL